LTLDQHANEAHRHVTDINEHVPTLRAYGAGKKVLELGVRSGVSTRAILAGKPLLLVSVDIGRMEYPDGLPEQADAEGIQWIRVIQDSGLPVNEAYGDFDVTFVDTLHTAGHVRRELAAHEPRTREFLIFHDTVTNETVGEDGGPGIMEPINELLAAGNWIEHERYLNNNGLLVLRRERF